MALVATALVWGQGSTAQVNGTIRDSSGLAVPAAGIRMVQTATGAVRTANSGADGGFIVPSLPIGPYQIEVTKDGFSKYVQTGIILQVDSNPTIDVALKIGAVSDQVTVEANTAQVETHSTGVGTVVDNQRVAEMPLNGRNPIELVFLAGMASTAGGVGTLNSVRNYPTIIVSVAGGQGSGNTYLLDGANYQDPYNSASFPLPFPDALQEFKVETSALPAQYGYHAGAAINAVTKSGTNEYHGDLFEFFRNGNLNARDFFAPKRDTLKRNQWGGTFGGPLLPRFRDKLFFFAGYQRTSQRSDPAQNTAFVPTPAMLGGNFSTIASTQCQPRQVTMPSNLGFTNNVIAPSLLNPAVLNVQKTMPISADPCGKTIFGFVANSDEDLTVSRVDWQINEKHSFFGRMTNAYYKAASTYDGKNPLSINAFGATDLNYSYALGDTYLFGANVVNSLRLSVNRANIVKVPDHYGSWSSFGSTLTPAGGDILSLIVTNAFNIGSSAAVPGEGHYGPLPSVNEDLSWIKGSHQFSFGGSIYYQQTNYWSGLQSVGSQTFNGSTSGLALGDWLIGQTSGLRAGISYGFYNRQYYTSLYAQDSWKLRSNLTLSYGLRWEPFLSAYSKFGQISHFDRSLFDSNVHSSTFATSPAGLVFPGDQQYACDNRFNCNQWVKFLPRIGMVWDPMGDGKMTIRGAFGMFADRETLFYYTNNAQDPPFGNSVNLGSVNIQNPWSGYPGGNPIPQLVQKGGIGHVAHDITFPSAGAYANQVLDGYKAPYTNQWNLSLQRQVGEWLLTANYLGNSSIHLTTSFETNPAVFLGTGACTLNVVNASNVVVPQTFPVCSTTANQNQRRVLYRQNPKEGQFYAGVSQVDNGGTGTYNALYFSANKRLSHGISVLANYTWAHCISDPFDVQSNTAQVIPGARNKFRSNCAGSDLRQQFNLNMVAQAPKFSNKVLRVLASDWQVAPILQIRSSQFFSVTSGTDRALTGIIATNQTPNLVGIPYPANQTVDGWVSLSAFALPPVGSYGNLGFYNMKGPSMFQLNVAASRTFRLMEKKTLQVRAEAFNLPNHLNPSTPVALVNAGNFGQITSDVSGNNGLSSGDPRIVQLAMKFVF